MSDDIQTKFQEYGSTLLDYREFHIKIRAFFDSLIEIPKLIPFDIINFDYYLDKYSDTEVKDIYEDLRAIALDVDNKRMSMDYPH